MYLEQQKDSRGVEDPMQIPGLPANKIPEAMAPRATQRLVPRATSAVQPEGVFALSSCVNRFYMGRNREMHAEYRSLCIYLLIYLFIQRTVYSKSCSRHGDTSRLI